jgi:phosphatidylinositol alpha-1,6-mannosyltransferase
MKIHSVKCLQNKTRILIVTRNLPPLIGGMERLNWHIADELSHDHQVILISHKDAKEIAPVKTNFYSVPLNPLPFFLILAFIKTLWVCLIKRPDILFAGSGLTAPIVVFWAKIFRKKSIIYIHGLDIGTNNKFYNILWIPFIRKATRVIANSSPTYELCLKKAISSKKIVIIHPGTDYPTKPVNLVKINQLKKQYQLHNKKILISVGRLTERKGLNEFINLSLPTIIKEIPQTILVIIGDTPTQSLNKNIQSKELILASAQKHNIQNHILFIGNISDDELLSSWYFLADIHVFPVKYISDDPEGFGMVAIEAAAHGTPTIAFTTGGVIDAVRHEKTGYLVKNQDYQNMADNIMRVLEDKNLVSAQICSQHAEKFAWYNLKRKFEKVIANI